MKPAHLAEIKRALAAAEKIRRWDFGESEDEPTAEEFDTRKAIEDHGEEWFGELVEEVERL